MKRPSLDGVRTFLAVAEHRSFSAAAAQLGMTTTAVSKTIKTLEQRHGVILFRRTTRSVALTEAGAELFAQLRSATSQIDDAFSALNAHRDKPIGTLRLTAPRALGGLILKTLIPAFHRRYPDIHVDISLDDGVVDLVAAGYDAGIRLGHAVAKDMVMVQLTPELIWMVVGSPDYFRDAGRPATPDDLIHHQTIRYRFPSSGILPRWRFKDREVETRGGLIVNDTTLIAEFARQGLGLAYLPAVEIKNDLLAGRLENILADDIPRTSGLYLYFPARTQQQPKLRVLIDAARAGNWLDHANN
ncbi:DNA-binding transcriptional LysR family regulator [Duganella sp. 1224]|uniref:LysR family transcriptional regulator n=1 Tax=Duganella sp. 1224 TaxID=2587052 RepID=UPI0015CA89B3|nr:LysR family transcriptional regulator [Duganella sp. 1224]NYE62865.1 DNA-binding transcriptional LysR family regulator [Duganella sp. 1224]